MRESGVRADNYKNRVAPSHSSSENEKYGKRADDSWQTKSRRKDLTTANPEVSVIRYSEETSTIVRGEKNGVVMKLLVNTGSRVTLLKEIGLGKMKDKNLKKHVPSMRTQYLMESRGSRLA